MKDPIEKLTLLLSKLGFRERKIKELTCPDCTLSEHDIENLAKNWDEAFYHRATRRIKRFTVSPPPQ